MPVTPTYPGGYIEEIPSGVRTITSVATSIPVFIDFFRRGPLDEAVQIFAFTDFEREFGGLHILSEASYAIQQCFLNGGAEAWVVRVGVGGFASATDVLADGAGGEVGRSSGRGMSRAPPYPGAGSRSLPGRLHPE